MASVNFTGDLRIINQSQVFILANFNITSAPWYAVVALTLIHEPDPKLFCPDVYLSGVKPE